MKLTTFLALCTTLVTLAQKPTLEPQKDWSKERTQLWLDSLVKSLTQETKILSNTTQNLSEQPPARTPEQEAADAEFKRISEMPPNYTIDGMPHYIPESDKKATEWAKKKTLFESQKYERAAKTIKDAEFIFEGFNIPMFQNMSFLSKDKKQKFFATAVHINKIYKGKGLNEGLIILIQPFKGSSDFVKFPSASNSNYFWFCNKSIFTFKHNKIFENKIQLDILNRGNGGDNDYKGVTLFNEIIFENRDSLYKYFNKYININTKNNSFDKNIENHIRHYNNVDELINEKKDLEKNPYKISKPINSIFRLESAQSLSFDIMPSLIRAGTDEFVTILGSGFGNTILGIGGIVSFPGQVRFRNADIGGKENVIGFQNKGYLAGLSNSRYLIWTDNKIILKLPSWETAFNGINTFSNTTIRSLSAARLRIIK